MTLAVFLALLLTLWGVVYAAGPWVERLLTRAAHRTAAYRYGDYLPVIVALAIGLLLTMAAGDAFIDLAELVQANSEELTAIDANVHAWAHFARESDLTTFFTFMTHLGDPITLTLLVAGVAAILAVQGRWRLALYLALTAAAGALFDLQLKLYFARARPELAEALRQAHGYSFPSGHAMGATVCFGPLAYVAFRMLRGWRSRAFAIALAVTLVVSIAASRVYLGVHWISDVGAGVAAGIIWVATTTVAYETFRRIRLVRSLRAKRQQIAKE